MSLEDSGSTRALVMELVEGPTLADRIKNREKQLGVVRELTDIVAAAANDPALSARTWVLITESPEGGWGISRHANTSADIVAAARAELRVEARERCKKWRATLVAGA